MTEVKVETKIDIKESSITEKSRDRLRIILLETMLAVEGRAKELAPVDTGRLRSSIHTFPKTPSDVVSVADGVNYGVFLEYGTIKMNPQPFMRPGADRAIKLDLPRIVKKYEDK